MDHFQTVKKRHAAKLREYYEHCDYGLCEYSVGTRLMWSSVLHSEWTEVAGCLVMRSRHKGQVMYDYPVAGPDGDEDAALAALEADSLEAGSALVFSVVPECRVAKLVSRYPCISICDDRTWRDYVYYRQDLQLFAGRRYSGQRNHIKKFRTLWPQAEFRPLTGADADLIDAFWADYEAEFPKGNNEKAKDELKLAKMMLQMVGKPFFLAGGITVDGKLVALSLAEKCGDTLIIHIEKALYSYTGVYPTLVQEFVSYFGDGCQWVNREDDAADRGLRTSKLQYGPAKLASKFTVRVQNALMTRCGAEIPTLQTERLTLTALREEDIPAYNALVLDRDRNRWWGYDDVAGLGAPVTERSFFEVAQKDFENRQAVNFAVRLDGKLIGEAVLYRFDCRGGAELGCRIAPAYAGCGYGAEAFAAVADWALYGLHMDRIVAKCFKENAASYKMLSSCMRKKGEDDTFFHFEKLV